MLKRGSFLSTLYTSLPSLALGMLLAVTASLSSITLMGAAAYFLTMMGIAGYTGGICNIFILSALIRLCALLRTLLRYAERVLNHKLTFEFIEKWRLALFRRVLKLPIEEALRLKSADVERTLRFDLGVLEQLYIRDVLPCATAFVTGLMLTAFMLSVSFKVAFLYMLLPCAALLIPLLIVHLRGRVWLEHALSGDRLQESVSNLIGGLLDLTALNAVARSEQQVFEVSEKRSALTATLTFYGDFLSAAVTVVASLLLPLSLLILLPYTGKILSGEMAVAVAVVAMASGELFVALPHALLSLKGDRHSLKRILTLESKATEEAYSLKEHPLASLSTVSLEKVSYFRQGRAVLKDLSHTFISSRNYLIEGPVGAGKSTLIYLLSGLLAPHEGRLLLNGEDRGGQTLSLLRSHCALSLQELSFLPGSVREMFLSVQPALSEEEMWEALEVACLSQVIRALPQGLDTYLGPGGSGLSGGELRRLSLARAYCVKREFLLLDEPFEGLDEALSAQIVERVTKNRGGVIIITHQSFPALQNASFDRLEVERRPFS